CSSDLLEGTARGIAFQLFENLGLMPRAAIADEVKGLDQDVRAKMRKLGIKFGAYHIYVPASLKPAPRELALILYALKHGGVRQPGVSDLPQIVLSGRTSVVVDPAINPHLYEVAGFKVAGKRAVRIDILERLADIIRPLIALDASKHTGELPAGAAEGNGFRVTVEMTSLLGTSGEDFASVLTSLGYRVRRTPKAPPVEVAVGEATAEAAENAALPESSPAPASEPQDDQPAAPVAAAPVAAAVLDTAATQAVEGAGPAELSQGPDPAEEAAVDTAASDLGATAPAAEEKPAAPEFDEVWFPGGRRPDKRHRPNARGRRDEAAGADGKTRGAHAHRGNGDARKGRADADGEQRP